MKNKRHVDEYWPEFKNKNKNKNRIIKNIKIKNIYR